MTPFILNLMHTIIISIFNVCLPRNKNNTRLTLIDDGITLFSIIIRESCAA